MSGISQPRFRLAAYAALLALGGCIAFAEPEDFDIRRASPEQVARERAAIEAYRAAPYLAFDRDSDGALNRSEWRDHEWAFLVIYDADGSGDFTLSEWVHKDCGVFTSLDLYRPCSRVALREFLSATGTRAGRINQRHVRSRSDRFFRLNDHNNDSLVSEAELYSEERFRR